MKPADDDILQRWPVSKRVNNSRAPDDDATLIEIEADVATPNEILAATNFFVRERVLSRKGQTRVTRRSSDFWAAGGRQIRLTTVAILGLCLSGGSDHRRKALWIVPHPHCSIVLFVGQSTKSFGSRPLPDRQPVAR
jgi:hypothetical protein